MGVLVPFVEPVAAVPDAAVPVAPESVPAEEAAFPVCWPVAAESVAAESVPVAEPVLEVPYN